MTKNVSATVAVLLGLTCGITAQQPTPRSPEPMRSVTLSLTEYNRLTDLATRAPQPPGVPPVGAVLSNADLGVRIDGTTARGKFSLTGEALRAGVNRVTLLSGATIIEATQDGRPLPLIADGRQHAALVQGPSPFSVDLEWAAPLTLRPGRAVFVLPVPPAGAARATIDLPGDQADVRLSVGWITRRSSANGRTTVEATLDPGSATEVSWSMRDSAPIASARELRMTGDVMTMVTLGDSDIRMIALVDLTVVQGEPRTVGVRLPSGYELSGISGNSLETSDVQDDVVVLTLGDATARRHQVLLTLEQPHPEGSFTLDTGLVTVIDVQRESGEVAIEGIGTLDLEVPDRPGMQRIDVRELNPALRSLARTPLLSAFRYQRNPAAPPALTMAVTRFPDAGVLAAAVDRAVATTLVTAEGRALTEVALRVRNRSQPFLKLSLPPDASIVSLEVAGETAKPVLGADGTRIPLLRPGFRPHGAYDVSFVYLHAGTPFARKGAIEMMLPRMDIPIGIVEWEVFVPDNYTVRHLDGNVIAQVTIDRAVVREAERANKEAKARGDLNGGIGAGVGSAIGPGVGGGTGGGTYRSAPSGRIVISRIEGDQAGLIRGRIVDPSGAVLPGVTVSAVSGGVRRETTTLGDGTFVLDGIAPGTVTLTAQLPGFLHQQTNFALGADARHAEIVMPVASREETITVSAAAPVVDTATASLDAQVSQNVVNLQRRAAGVLPIPVDVPRAGRSHRFLRPLVVDDATTVTLRYARR
jgi:hypothetical protein